MKSRTRIRIAVVACSALAGLAVVLVFVAPRAPQTLVERVEVPDIDEVFDERDRLLAAQPELGRGDPLGRFPLSEDWARKLFPPLMRKGYQFEPHCYYTRKVGFTSRVPFPEHAAGGWKIKMNSLGLRDGEPRTQAQRRILVTGDSHTEGACAAAECFTEVLQNALRARGEPEVDVMNAAIGGYTFQNYLGVLERFLELDPDVFVVVVFGGNDFMGSLLLQHLFAGTRRSVPSEAYRAATQRGVKVFEPALPQEFQQLLYFRYEPHERAVALAAARSTTLEMQRVCAEAGIEFLVVYLPPMGDAQRARYEPLGTDMARALELTDADLTVTDRLADEWLGGARAAGVRVLDLREIFRAADVDLYWRTEHHISTAGHALVAEELLRELGDGR